jgi:putative FmdB family regulatory protein
LALEECECQELREGDVPTYQYACTACGHQLEAVQSFSDSPLTECPECAGRLRKLFSSVGIVFKGSGFYRTDSRADSSGNGESRKDGASSKDGAGKETVSAGSTGSGDGGTKNSGAKSGGASPSTPSKGTSPAPVAA